MGIKALLKYSFLCLLLISIGEAASEQTENWKGYEIHYSVVPSSFLSQEVAKIHSIVRANGRIIINIAIKKDGASTNAQVEGTVSNLLKQQSRLHFREIVNNQTIYYLANIIFDDKDKITFWITIKPENESETYELKFTRQYY